MGGRVGAEPPLGFLQLPPAPDLVAAAGLVPGHGHVHEPLEEVALVRRGRTPDVLEHLVRGEVLARLDQGEAALQFGGQVSQCDIFWFVTPGKSQNET